jgi:nucleoside-diphosphate-sugar epimerase
MSASPRAVVTGAHGFVGRHLVARLGPESIALSMASEAWREGLERTRFAGATVYHLAARVHGGGRGSEEAFFRDNVAKTEALAERAAREGARRLIFMSSVKVLGEETAPGRPFDAGTPPAPQDAYGRSKLAAEAALARIAAATGLELAIVRPPLVYGRGALGNLRSLVRLADTPLPLPLGGIENRRSFIHVEDLCDLLLACASDASAAGGTWLAAHARAASTPEIVGGLRRALGRPERLFPAPRAAIELGGERLRRLTRSLEVDASATREGLHWDAKRGLDLALADIAATVRTR